MPSVFFSVKLHKNKLHRFTFVLNLNFLKLQQLDNPKFVGKRIKSWRKTKQSRSLEREQGREEEK